MKRTLQFIGCILAFGSLNAQINMGDWTELTGAALSTGATFDEVASGDLDLSAYKNATTYIAFRYQSNTTDGTATWQIDDVNVEEVGGATSYLTDDFEGGSLTGNNAWEWIRFFVKMGQKYYCNEGESKAYWMPEDKLIGLCEKVEVLEHLLIGEKAPNLILQDTTEEKWVNLHKDVKAKFTVLVFWDPDCSHCKKEIPKINDVYNKLKDSIDIKVVGVGGLLETDKWKTFILEKELTDWIHISDNPEIHNNAYNYLDKTTIESLNFRQTYDIFSYPQVYLLDEDKIILGKKLGAEGLGKIILNYHKR